jgi:hypothetical protein
VVFGKDTFVIREVAGKLARHQKPVTHLKKQVIVVPGEDSLGIGSCLIGKPNQFDQRLLWDQCPKLLV